MADNIEIENKNNIEDRAENNSTSPASSTPKIMNRVFAVFMIAIYFGMGGLTISGYFDILFGQWHWMKWALGLLFIVYGIWRAYRYIKGRG